MAETPMSRYSFRIPEWLGRWLEEKAAEDRRTVGAMIRLILEWRYRDERDGRKRKGTQP